MATEPVPSSVTAPVAPAPAQPLQTWLARLGLSGKLLAIGALVGVIAVFLPLWSVSMQMPANPFGGKAGINLPTVSNSHSVLVIGDFRGILCLLGYLGAIALAIVLYLPTNPGVKALNWAILGLGGFLALLALWLLASAVNGSSTFSGFGGSIQGSVGLGAILNLLSAATIAVAGFLKAREEKLF